MDVTAQFSFKLMRHWEKEKYLVMLYLRGWEEVKTVDPWPRGMRADIKMCGIYKPSGGHT